MHRRALRATVAGIEVDVPVGTWAAGQVLRFTGADISSSADSLLTVPSDFTAAGTSPTDITGLAVAVAKAGTYAFDFYLHHTLSAQPRTIGFCINASASFTSIAAVGELWLTATTFNYGTQTANNTAFTGSKTITGTSLARLRGQIVVSGACTLSCRAQSSATTLTVLAGSGGYFIEA